MTLIAVPTARACLSRVVYLQRAGKYQRPAWRLSQGQKGLDRGSSWPLSGPLPAGDALETVRVDTRRLPRPPSRAAAHHRGWLIPPLAGAMAARGTAAPPAV